MEKTSGQIDRERRLKKSEINIKDLTICHYCKSTGLGDDDKFCPNCGFPQRGSQIEMKRFLNRLRRKMELLADYKKSIKKARNILFILAAVNLLYGLIMGVFISVNMAVLISSIIVAAIYFALGMWSRNKPFPAILSGFFVYIVFNVLAAIVDPHTIYQGLIWKVIIISAFVYGYKGVKDSANLQVELESMKESKDLKDTNAV